MGSSYRQRALRVFTFCPGLCTARTGLFNQSLVYTFMTCLVQFWHKVSGTLYTNSSISCAPLAARTDVRFLSELCVRIELPQTRRVSAIKGFILHRRKGTLHASARMILTYAQPCPEIKETTHRIGDSCFEARSRWYWHSCLAGLDLSAC